MSRARRIGAVFAGFAVALPGAWAIDAVAAQAFMRPGGQVWPTLVLAPLGGLALFALVYGLIAGAMPRGRFWLVGSVATILIMAGSLLSIARGYATVVEALVLGCGTLFILALVTLGRR